MVIPPLIENPYINPYCKLDDHHLPQGANVSLDPGIVLGCHERASLIKSKITQQKSHHGPPEMLRLLRIGCQALSKIAYTGTTIFEILILAHSKLFWN